MNLVYRSRLHRFDWFACRRGTRLFTLDVWIDATPEEIAKLKEFNMLKRDFIEVSQPRGLFSLGAFVASSLTTWFAYGVVGAEPSTVFALGLVSLLFGMSAKSKLGTSTKGRIKVADLLRGRPVPFTHDNMAEIHEVVVSVREQYQSLFGAMVEIEHFEIARDAVWREEVAA